MSNSISARKSHLTVGYVNWPDIQPNEDYTVETGIYDTREGGCEIWLVVPYIPELPGEGLGVRSVCATGFYPGIVTWDAVGTRLHDYIRRNSDVWGIHKPSVDQRHPAVIDGAICIAASGRSPFDADRREYWCPTFTDLTEEGKQLYKLIKELYQIEPELHFVLDT